MIKKKYHVKNMHCTSCAMVIETDLEDVGVVAACSFAKQTLEVEFDEKKVTEESIKQAVKKSGYDII